MDKKLIKMRDSLDEMLDLEIKEEAGQDIKKETEEDENRFIYR